MLKRLYHYLEGMLLLVVYDTWQPILSDLILLMMSTHTDLNANKGAPISFYSSWDSAFETKF